jgi:hypothetical protein
LRLRLHCQSAQKRQTQVAELPRSPRLSAFASSARADRSRPLVAADSVLATARILKKPSDASPTRKGRFGTCVVCGDCCGNCGGAGRACGNGPNPTYQKIAFTGQKSRTCSKSQSKSDPCRAIKDQSIPMKSPITQSPEVGHCARTSKPSTIATIPSTACQPQPGNATHIEPIN